MNEYPTVFPMDEARLVLMKLQGQSVPAADLAHAAWVFAGWGLSMALPLGVSAVEFGEAEQEMVAEIAAAAGVQVRARGENGVQAQKINWKALLAKVLPLIIALL